MQRSLIVRSFAIGAATGLRSMTGPAAVAGSAGLGRILPFLAVGEYVVDLVPGIPARTMPAALAVRIIAGGLAAGSLARGNARERGFAALAGIAGAVAASYAGAGYRKLAARVVPDAVAAVLEDAAAILIARAAAGEK